MRTNWLLPGVLGGFIWSVVGANPIAPAVTTISIVGTTDLHGRIVEDVGRGGLSLLGGFLKNLRAARQEDGGAVLLLDAGDTFQGGIESNLSEGAVVVDAYNALGYTALAIGNHDFEFGERDEPSGEDADTDPRGALKAAAARAHFPFLAANLVDASTEAGVSWPNVHPSAIVEAAGVPVGLIGVMTVDGLSMTLAANVGGLHTTPLVPALTREARALRARGAQLVIVVAHAGGYCEHVESPTDLSSCDESSEIFEVARQLPSGLVNAIVGGHTHAQVAHSVAGIPIIQAGSVGQAFARVDLQFDRRTAQVVTTRVHPPRPLCAWEGAPGVCLAPGEGARPVYEGRAVEPDPRIDLAMAPQLAGVRARRAAPLGIVAASPLTRAAYPESALANAFADAVRHTLPNVDAAVSYGAGMGGLRADLPAGPVSFGMLYDVFPFDNRMVRVHLTGDEVRMVLTEQVRRRRGRLTGLSGLRATVRCRPDGAVVDITRMDGQVIVGGEPMVVAVPEYSSARMPWTGPPVVTPVRDPTRPDPMLRQLVLDWMRARDRPLDAGDFLDPRHPRWRFVGEAPACGRAIS